MRTASIAAFGCMCVTLACAHGDLTGPVGYPAAGAPVEVAVVCDELGELVVTYEGRHDPGGPNDARVDHSFTRADFGQATLHEVTSHTIDGDVRWPSIVIELTESGREGLARIEGLASRRMFRYAVSVAGNPLELLGNTRRGKFILIEAPRMSLSEFEEYVRRSLGCRRAA